MACVSRNLSLLQLTRLVHRGVAQLLTVRTVFVQVTVESSLGALSLAKGEHYGVAFPDGYNASSTTLFMTGLQVQFSDVAPRFVFLVEG